MEPTKAAFGRHHTAEPGLQRAVKEAVRMARLGKPASCHSLRHFLATHLLAGGTDIRTVQDLPGHEDVGTTRIYARRPKLVPDAMAGSGEHAPLACGVVGVAPKISSGKLYHAGKFGKNE